jgi:hypothetical protein
MNFSYKLQVISWKVGKLKSRRNKGREQRREKIHENPMAELSFNLQPVT